MAVAVSAVERAESAADSLGACDILDVTTTPELLESRVVVVKV